MKFDQVILRPEDWPTCGKADKKCKTRTIMAQSIPSVPIAPSIYQAIRKLQMPHGWASRLIQKLQSGAQKCVQMPHPRNEAKGMLPSKKLKIAYCHPLCEWSKQC